MPYVIANTLVSVPFIFLIALVFSSIAYPMCNFHPGADHFFVYVTMLFAALMVAESMTVAVSAIIPHFIAGM
jgi:ABC-type multidrug transport system permease subunit